MRLTAIVFALVACGDGARSSGNDAASNADAGIDAADEARPWIARATTITDEHRAIPGVMFGGWGPHLGHLVQAAGSTYWVDDLCERAEQLGAKLAARTRR